jgi:hypothetical protein
MKKINQLAAANKMIKALRKGIGRFRLKQGTAGGETGPLRHTHPRIFFPMASKVWSMPIFAGRAELS